MVVNACVEGVCSDQTWHTDTLTMTILVVLVLGGLVSFISYYAFLHLGVERLGIFWSGAVQMTYTHESISSISLEVEEVLLHEVSSSFGDWVVPDQRGVLLRTSGCECMCEKSMQRPAQVSERTHLLDRYVQM